ncbi:MAG TPA: phosphoglucosamine mutase [Clostridiaceae bacterium]|nr:phosphoglucosamine mutase [Clostridiaceae bacterium]
MTRLFGTDGIRGIANRELTPDLVYKIGFASANVLAGVNSHRPVFLVGRDTRISGTMLEAALVAGLTSAGADVFLAGIIPTPGVAYLTRKNGFDAGVVISASHNPFEHNGIKLFSGDGYKLSDEIEDQIEKLIRCGQTAAADLPVGEDIGHSRVLENASREYEDYLLEHMPVDLNGMKIAVDCANGASFDIAPVIFKELGAEVIAVGVDPNGVNINFGCGSTDLALLVETVQREGCDLGLAFDGDADRLLAVDDEGNIIDGDLIMAIIAKDMQNAGKLAKNTLVATVMSNLGLVKMGLENDIEVVCTQVGDRYVLEEMLRSGYVLGGEQSGHLILLEHATTGDGILSALRLLQALRNSGQKLSQARKIMNIFPQILINVEVANADKTAALQDLDINESINNIADELGDSGRIFVRASGTESIIRVMIEGEKLEDIKHKAELVAQLLCDKYGVNK